MSVFLTSFCKYEQSTFPQLISWSNSDSIAAVSAYCIDDNNENETYMVNFINNEAILLPNISISLASEPSSLAWQTSGRILAIGCKDGSVSCWYIDGKSKPIATYSNVTQHNAAISLILWNPIGKRVLTGDERGLICIWVVDVRGSLTPIRQYKRRGRVTTAVFCVLPFKLDSLKKSSTDSKFTFSPSFFFGTDQGALVYADDLGHCTDVQQLVSPIDIMLFFEERSRLIIITRSLLLTQYQVADDGRVTRISQVKLSLPVDNNSGLKFVVWAAPGVIALAANEKFIRLFDIITDENYNLPLSADKNNCIPKSDSVHAIAFSRIDRYLVVGTKLGNILIWKYSGSMRDFSGDNKMAVEIIGTSVTDWELCYSTNLPISSPSPIIEFQWHRSNGSLGIVTEEGVVVLSEMKMQIGICDELSVIQTGSHEVTVTINGAKNPIVQATAILIKGISVASSCFLVWSGKDARVFKVDAQPGKIRVEPLDAFITNGSSCAISDNIHIAEESIFIAEQNSVRICNFTGIQKQTISFSEAEGIVQHISVNGRNLATITDKGIIGIYDVHSPKKPKPLGSTGQFFSAADNVGGFYPLDIRGIKVNCDGSRVAILADHVEGSLRVRHPDTRLHVYDRNKGSVNTFNFNSFSRFPVNVCWDSSDHRILAVEAQILRHLLSKTTKLNDTKSDLNNTTDSNLDTESDVDIYLFFATSEDGILFQDSFPRKSPFGSLLGLIVPRLYFVSSVVKSNEKESVEENDVKVMSKVMRDFVGLEDCNEATKAALLDFSYNITLGKVDDAYRAVRAIASPTIWENMAQICVKTKRLDVAEVCLGQMGHVRGAAALRDSKKYNNVDASIGVLALQLGLYDDAIRCFREANRPDLMNQLYQAAGLWEKAVKIAKSQDHIHLQATHFQYAKHLESIHDVKGAIKHFKQSNTFRQEVPRMLYALGRMDQLEKFVESTFSSQQDEDENVKTHDPILLKWWGSYLESEKNYDLALTYYNRANDYLSVVRILCFLGQYEEAANTIMEVGDRAGAYHFARQLEHQGEYHEAINFYAMAGCYNHSIRLAKAYSMDADLMGYALKSGSSSLMFDCASYFENKREFEKAVELYYKCGDFGRALELCFRVGEQLKSRGKNEQSVAMFDMMNTIVQSLGTEDGSNNISPQTLARCAEFHIKHKQFEKAIDLYVLAHKFTQAFEMCLQYKVPLNESLVEKLTPPSSVISDVQERKNTLKHLAEVLKNQSLWSLAYKKYMEAGDQINAMKSLVRTGDAKKIITAAKIANKTDMYIIAANYLQQLDWRENIEILKAIILFYTKAKAFEQLATFYDSVAMVEIDEYRDYAKAVEALKESLKHLSKAEASNVNAANYASAIETRIVVIESFIRAKSLLKRNPDEMVAVCEKLLQDPNLEESIRSGDCYAVLIEYFFSINQFKKVFDLLLEMEKRDISLKTYIDMAIVDEVFKTFDYVSNKASRVSHTNADEIEEELDESIEHDTSYRK